jgi:hypothetical protein
MGVSHVALANHDRALGHEEERTITDVPANILFPPLETVTKAVIQVLDADVVYQDDGADPTLTRGIIVSAGDILVVEMNTTTMRALRMRVNAATGTARVRVAYYGA